MSLPVLSRREAEKFSLRKLRQMGARVEKTELGVEVWFRREGTFDFIYGCERLDVVIRKSGASAIADGK